MPGATLRIRLVNVTLSQLYDELDKLRFAGWGNSAVEFTTATTNCVEIKLYRVLTPEPDPGKATKK